MWNLVYKEFAQLRTHLLQILVLAVIVIILFGGLSSGMTMAYLYALPVALSLNMPQIIFAQEERRNTFAFLRSLPVSPSHIVAAKYLAFAVINVGFLVIIIFAGVVGAVPLEEAVMAVSTVSLISFTLAGLSSYSIFGWG